MQNLILIKHTASGTISETTEGVWNLMKLDGRSRKYSVVPKDAPLFIEPKAEVEKIEIRPVFTKKKKKDEPEAELTNGEINQELQNEGTD